MAESSKFSLPGILLVTLLGAGGPALARTVVPIHEVDLPNGDRRFSIPITVGATPITAGLDSGSSGLRILPGALMVGDAQDGAKPSSYAYGAGTKFDGVAASAKVTVGDLSQTIKVQDIKTIGCLAAQPDCPASKVAMKDFGVQSDGLPGQGFKAIIGVNMADADADSPLKAIGAKTWIINLPLPGSGQDGSLILNPDPVEIADYKMFKIDPTYAHVPGGMHDGISACLTNTASKASVCGPALLDTGQAGMVVDGAGTTSWPAGTPVILSFTDGDKAQTSAAFATERRDFGSHLSFTGAQSRPGLTLTPGFMPFFAYSVLYDPAKGEIGLKPRADSKMTVQ